MVVTRFVLATLLLAGVAHAETVPQFWDKMDREYTEAPRTGQSDHDFAMTMVPLYRGAYDMAVEYLRTGRDPALRAQAQRIVTQSQDTVRFLRGWQARGAGAQQK